MPHYQFESLECDWKIVRETACSMTLRGSIKDLSFSVDLHFTPPRIATATLIFIGPKGHFTDGLTHSIFEDLSHLLLRRNLKYSILDYSLCFTEDLLDGNFELSPELVKSYQPSSMDDAG